MTIEEVSNLLKSNIGNVLRVTPLAGEPEILQVLSVDLEGFTYHLLGPGQDEAVTHWWPTDEISSVEVPFDEED